MKPDNISKHLLDGIPSNDIIDYVIENFYDEIREQVFEQEQGDVLE